MGVYIEPDKRLLFMHGIKNKIFRGLERLSSKNLVSSMYIC